MKTLNISISNSEFESLGLKKEKMSFAEFIEIISREVARMNLLKSVELAEKYNLSEMNMDEITEEVKAYIPKV